MKIVTKYIAENGREFEDKDTCLEYEKNLKREKIIEKRITDLLQEKESRLKCQINNGYIEIFIGKEEIDEDLDYYIEMEDFENIEKIIIDEFSFEINIPISYWSK